MILAGQTLYVLEVQPAAYAALAANEAEKQLTFRDSGCRQFRLYLWRGTGYLAGSSAALAVLKVYGPPVDVGIWSGVVEVMVVGRTLPTTTTNNQLKQCPIAATA